MLFVGCYGSSGFGVGGVTNRIVERWERRGDRGDRADYIINVCDCV